MSAQVLLGKIHGVRSRSRSVQVGIGVSRSVITAVVLVAAFFLLDWLVVSRTFEEASSDLIARGVLIVAMLGALGYVVWRDVWRELRRNADDDEVALQIEKGHPELRGRLIGTIQLTREMRDAPAIAASSSLIEALEEETVEFARAIDFADVIDLGAMRKVLMTAAAVIIAAAGLAAWRADFTKALMSRLAFGNAAYPTKTRIVSLSPGAKVARGEAFNVDLCVDAQGYVPDEASVELKTGAQPPVTLPLVKLPEQADPAVVRYRLTVEHVLEDISFRAAAYDARIKEWQHLHVLLRPEIKSLALTYQFPAYARKPSETSSIGDVRALSGTTVRIEALFNKRVTSAKIQRRTANQTGEPADMALGADGAAATYDLAVAENGYYRILLRCVDDFDNANPIDYSIVALKDRAPTVKILSPTQDKSVTNFARYPIRFQVRDDYGIGAGSLAYAVISDEDVTNDAPPEPPSMTLPLPELAQHANERECTGEFILDLASLKVAEGQRVAFWVEAHDNCAPAANVGKSSKYHFNVVDRSTMEEILERQRKAAMNQVNEIMTKQKTNRDDVDAIRREKLNPAPVNPAKGSP